MESRRTVGTVLAVMLALLAALSTGVAWAAGEPAPGPTSAALEPESSGLPPGTGGSWWSAAQEKIQAAEYEITWQDRTVLAGLDRAWHAPNRAHDLRTYFTDAGIRVVRRTETTPSWEWSLSLIGYGRSDKVYPVGTATLSPHLNRIDYDRGEIVEWYVNDMQGLEQGFTLQAPPGAIGTGRDADEALVGGRGARFGKNDETHSFVVLALNGTLSPVISTDGQAIDFTVPGGAKVLHYAELYVVDASGQQLDAWMEGFAEAGVRGIRIVFDDSEAAYPVTIDPLATSPAWTAETDQDGAWFGFRTDTAGDVNGDGYADVIVAAYAYDNGETDEGAAFVYHGSASGLSSTAAWTAEGDQAAAHLGCGATTAGDVNGDGYADVIVGACHYDNGHSNEGAAVVYHGSVAGLSATAAWSQEGNQSSAEFGSKVGAAGDVNGDGFGDVVIGTPLYDNGQANEGGAWVYHGSVSGLSSTAAWEAEGNQAGAYFAYWVATAGDVNGDGYADVIIGARDYDNAYTDGGAAFLYYGSGTGLSATPDWSVEGDQTEGRLGVRVGTAGDVDGDGYADVFVTTTWYDFAQTNQGAAFVYQGSASGPSLTADWTGEGVVSSGYGIVAGTAGDVNGDGYADFVVGADQFDDDQANEGRVYMYLGSDAGLATTSAWTRDGDQAGASYGKSATAAGDVNGDGFGDVIVGAYLHDNVETNEGQAYVYHGSASGLGSAPGWTAEGDQAEAYFGFAVSTAGDVNGDGYADIIVGTPYFDNGETEEGCAWVYQGSATGLSLSASWTAEGDQSEAYFGFDVSTAGDVNGDGYDDAIVGARYFDNEESNEGRAFVYHGSVAGLSVVKDWSAESDQGQASFGTSVSTAGDVNGDGYADVIVGAELYDNGETDQGRAFVYHGSAAGLGPAAAWSAESDQPLARFGHSVSAAGDVNGDGYADVIVGAGSYDNGEANEGKAWVYQGSAAGLSLSASWTAEGDQAEAYFGSDVSTAGDVNGDGYADIIVGSDCYTTAISCEGRAWVYHGSMGGLSTFEDWTAEGDQTGAGFGMSVSTAGDVNGDGYADVLVGALGYNNSETDEGRAYVYHGSASGLDTVAIWTAESDQERTYFGNSVSTAGDVNGDGCADIIVGAYYYSDGETHEGRAYLYYGNDGPGLSLTPQQRRADNLAPIADGGRSNEPGSFRLAATGRTPFGRGNVKLQWEVKPLGDLFDGTGTGESGWSDTGTTGVTINELVSGLDPGEKHWRMRLLYDPVTTPFAQAGRWFTVPWKGWEEADLALGTFIGGQVWDDNDGDGIMETGEPRLANITVQLLDDTGVTIGSTLTSVEGSYWFEVDPSDAVRLRFIEPMDWSLTAQDQGGDDLVDSDADASTGETVLIVPPFDGSDAVRWSAGLREEGACLSPGELVWIDNARLTTDGNDHPILDFVDANESTQVTGYNIYRSSDAGLGHASWPRVANDVVDMRAGEPDLQWLDTSGDVSPSDIWFYQVAAYNHDCPPETAEGPW